MMKPIQTLFALLFVITACGQDLTAQNTVQEKGGLAKPSESTTQLTNESTPIADQSDTSLQNSTLAKPQHPTSESTANLAIQNFQPSTQLSVDSEQILLCDAPDKTPYRLLLTPQGQAYVSLQGDNSGQYAQGEYALQNNQFHLSVPALGFAESSTEAYAAEGLMLRVITPSLICRAAIHTKGPAAQTSYRCPSTRLVSGVDSGRFQDNTFEFYEDRSVRRRSIERVRTNGFSDDIPTTDHGIYYIQGSRFFMAFGTAKRDMFLTGSVNPDGSFTVDQYSPQQACTEN